VAGLLDFYSDPQQQAMLGLSAGLLQAGGPSRFPQSFGQGLSQGLLQGSHLAQNAVRAQLANAYMGEQTKQMQMANALAAQRAPLMNQLAARIAAGAYGGGVQQPAASEGLSDASAVGIGAPWAAASQLPQAAPQQMGGGAAGGGIGLDPRDLALLKLIGGPDLTAAYTAGQPKVQTTPSGVQYDEKTGRVLGTLPVVSEAFGGYQMRAQPGGGYAMGGVAGGADLRRGALQVGAEVQAANAPATITIGGRPVQTTQAVANAIATGYAPNQDIGQMAAELLARNGAQARIGVGAPSQWLGPAAPGVQGAPAASPPFAQAPRAGGALPPGAQPTAAENAGATEFATGKAKEAVAESTRWRNAHMETSDRLGQLDLLQTLMSDPNTASGTSAESISGLKGIADSFGVSIAGKRSEDAISAVAGEMALKLRTSGGQNLMPGQMSDFEQKLLKSMSPGLAQSREGRLLVVQIARAKNERDLKLAEMAANYEDSRGQIDSGFYKQAREYVRANPMYPPERIAAMTELSKRLGSATAR
jgi:hypothetical protein